MTDTKIWYKNIILVHTPCRAIYLMFSIYIFLEELYLWINAMVFAYTFHRATHFGLKSGKPLALEINRDFLVIWLVI